MQQVKIKWEFLQPFTVFWRIFLHAIMDKSAEGGLKGIGNTTMVQTNPLGHGKQLQKFQLNLKLLNDLTLTTNFEKVMTQANNE